MRKLGVLDRRLAVRRELRIGDFTHRSAAHKGAIETGLELGGELLEPLCFNPGDRESGKLAERIYGHVWKVDRGSPEKPAIARAAATPAREPGPFRARRE